MTISTIRKAVAAGFALAFAAAIGVTSPAQAVTSPVTVSLTFDDGSSSHAWVGQQLSNRGMRGTFYINSQLAGSSSYYLNWTQIHALADAGMEIGGHTLTHAHLTQITAAVATHEICDDRIALQNQGFSPSNFAYPYAESNASVEQIVQSCGYASARTVGNLNSGPVCSGCAYTETVPPRDAYFLRTPEAAVSSTTLATLQSYVTGAETHGGGWLPMVFHGVCDNACTGSNSLSTGVFTAFLDWLAARATSGTVVRTIADVMSPSSGGADLIAPTTTAACNGCTCTGWYRNPVNVTLNASDGNGSGVSTTSVSTGAGFAPYAGPINVAATTAVQFFSTDVAGNTETTRNVLVSIDGASPTVSVSAPLAGSTYRRGAKVTVTATAADLGTGGGAPSGISGVTFYDGSVLLGTDATAPYTVSWNTRKDDLGQRVLTAVARDVAGNVTTSAGVAVQLTK